MVIDFEKRVKEASLIITKLISNDMIRTNLSSHDITKFTDFFLKQSKLSLITSDILYSSSTDKKAREFHQLSLEFESFLWVINSAYYSMFYAVHALLAHKGIRLLSHQGIHRITLHALIHFCIKNDFIAKKWYDIFLKSQDEASELFKFEDFKKKANDLATQYHHEGDKRSKFTYETSLEVRKSHALTSLNRAKHFFNEIKKVIVV